MPLGCFSMYSINFTKINSFEKLLKVFDGKELNDRDGRNARENLT